MGAGGRDALVDLCLDEAELLDLVAGVHAVAARTAFGDRELVAFFPGPQGRRRDAQHLPDRADAVDRPTAHRVTLANPLRPSKPATSVSTQDLLRMKSSNAATPRGSPPVYD